VAVRPSIVCGSCGAPLNAGDKFCAKCGTAVLWDTGLASVKEEIRQSSVVTCPSCGIQNAAENTVCSGCGSPLTAKSSAKKKSVVPGEEPAKKGEARKKIESWKVLSVAGAIVVAVLVGIGVFRNPPKEASSEAQQADNNNAPSVSPTLLSDIEALQKNVDISPNDAALILQLANALHDAKFLPRAIENYKKYLRMKPTDPDARVDMGICYYENGDSQTAIKEMQTALTYNPKHQMALFNLGIVTLNQGNLAESNEWFKKAVGVDPNSQVGQRAQQILTQHSTIQQ
jgi:cytochrome c-type biogenesis protein CcmH/NrfG/DNA-directed RNA polymerase subunit RPC12/RpoP